MYIACDDQGRVLWWATTALANTEGVHVHPVSRLPDETDWWDGSALLPRPAPPAPPALVAGVGATWTGLPVGAVVTVDPLNGGAVLTDTVDAAGEVEISLPAGPWRIAVNEVFPAVAAEWLIEVAPE